MAFVAAAVYGVARVSGGASASTHVLTKIHNADTHGGSYSARAHGADDKPEAIGRKIEFFLSEKGDCLKHTEGNKSKVYLIYYILFLCFEQ